MKTVLTLLTILLNALALSAQIVYIPPKSKPKCDVLPAEALPTVRGLRLGMTEKEVNASLGVELTFRDSRLLPTRIALFMPRGRPGFEGVSSVDAATFDGKLYEIGVKYDDSVKWANINELIDNFSPKLGVPKEAWSIANEDYANITCRDFDLRLFAVKGKASLRLADTAALRVIGASKSKTEDDAGKAAAKP